MRRLIIIACLTIASRVSFGQQQKIYTSSVFDSSASTLKTNGTDFTIDVSTDLIPEKGAGTFKIRQDSIYFQYRNLVNPDASVYDLKRSKTKGASLSHIKASFSDGQQPKAALVMIRSKADQLIKTFPSDSLGRASVDIEEFKNASELQIGFVGYDSVFIPIRKLIGHETAINVILKPQLIYYIPAHVDAYQKVQFDDDKIVLKKGRETIIYKALK